MWYLFPSIPIRRRRPDDDYDSRVSDNDPAGGPYESESEAEAARPALEASLGIELEARQAT